jgi:hypothetical protein
MLAIFSNVHSQEKVSLKWCEGENDSMITETKCLYNPIQIITGEQICKVTSFFISFSYKGDYYSFDVKGDVLSREIINSIKKCPVRTVLFFDQISGNTPSGENINIGTYKISIGF